MNTIYTLIQQNPEFFAWVFGIVNVLWGAFLYFNKKRHDRELKKLQHSLNLDLERRKQFFELKVSQYERYVVMLDEFGRKYQTELMDRMQPMFQEYMSAMLVAKTEEAKNMAIGVFSTQVMELMNESSTEYLKLKAESRSLKLTASDRLIEIFEALETLVKESMDSAQEFIKQLPALIMSGNSAEMTAQQTAINRQAENIQTKSNELEQQMRSELKDI
jgi:hypothetical protein